MLLRNVLLKSIRDLRWPVFWTGLGLALLGAYFMWIFPTFTKTMDLASIFDKMPTGLKALIGGSLIDLNTSAGWLNTELFPLMLPLVLGGFAIALASGETASEESRGTLDLLLAEPIERWRALSEKTLASVLATVAVGLALFLGIVVVTLALAIDLPVDRLLAGLVAAVLLSLAFGSIALALAAFSGNRAMSIGVAVTVMIVSYFVNALAPLVDFLNSIRGLSLFYYYIGNDPLRNGLDLGKAAVLALVAVVGFGIAIVAFERRDLAA